MQKFAARFKQLRNEKGMTQEELRKDFNARFFRNYTAAAISRYENGKRVPEIDALGNFAEYFGVCTSFLLGETDVRKPENSPPNIRDEYSRMHKITKRDLNQYDDFTKQANAFFMNDEVADADKEKLFRDMTELFWKSKEINKQKYGRKKKTKSHTE